MTKESLNELLRLQTKLYPEFPPQPRPPATEVQITDLERKLGFALSPSYREFLKIHNGWENFGVFILFGTEDFFSDWTKSRIASFKEVDAGGPFEKGAIPFSMSDEASHFWAFDPKIRSSSGELDVVKWDHGQEEYRLHSLTEFFEKELTIQRHRASRYDEDEE